MHSNTKLHIKCKNYWNAAIKLHRLWNDLLRVGWGVKLNSLTHYKTAVDTDAVNLEILDVHVGFRSSV